MIFDLGDGCIRRFVCPNGVYRALPAADDAVIGAVALVGTVGRVVCRDKQRRIHVRQRDILDCRVIGFLEGQGALRVGNDASADGNNDARRIRRNRNGHVGTGAPGFEKVSGLYNRPVKNM